VHHDHKKAYFVALRKHWFVFDKVELERKKKALREEDGLTEQQIEDKM